MSSQESGLSLPPPSPMSLGSDPLLTPTLDPLMSFQGLSSPSDSTMLMSGSQDPMLSMPSPGQGSDLGLMSGLPTVLGSPGPLMVSTHCVPCVSHRLVALQGVSRGEARSKGT